MSFYTLPQQPNGSGGETVVIYNQTVIAMAASSLTGSTAVPITNFNGRGIMAWMQIDSFAAGSGSTTYALKLKVTNPLGGGNVTLGGAPALSASGVSTLMIYPGITTATAVANTQLNIAVPRDLQIVASLSAGATSKGAVVSLAYMILM